nr:ACP S-malonyltransferase [uncultured Agathobaculum sp.]
MEYGFAFFPGQGAQAPGMGKDLYDNSQAARQVFEEASEGAGIDVRKLCFDSDKDTLSRTENSQIAIFTHSMAALAALSEAGVTFKAAAGFSLGEYTALAAAGVVTLADGVKIVSMRGKLMQQAADAADSGMAAILGLEDEKIESACAQVTSGVVRPVNYNCPGQLVIAGERAALDEAIENCKAAGARRALPLAVSGAFHTPLMAKAAAELRAFLSDFTFAAPRMDIYSNLDGEVLSCADLPAHLEQHMVSPVRWTQLVQNGMAAGLSTSCEIGPGKTLTGFASKISKELVCHPVQDMAGVKAAAGLE